MAQTGLDFSGISPRLELQGENTSPAVCWAGGCEPGALQMGNDTARSCPGWFLFYLAARQLLRTRKCKNSQQEAAGRVELQGLCAGHPQRDGPVEQGKELGK